ncbi:MAG: hypothetical protein C4570_02035 [Ammonifex sp.]|nr:MAG: hypothetical protein C4570_02035 [Ammonifex sp.]
MKNHICRFIVFLFLAMLGLPFSIPSAATLAEMKFDLKARGVYLDSKRFTDTVLNTFFNDQQEAVAAEASCIEKCTTIVLTGDIDKFKLPSDFFLIRTAILNANPEVPVSESNRRKALKFVPIEKFGTESFFTTGRPSEFSISEDTLRINVPSKTGVDTVQVHYFAYPRVLGYDTSTVSLPKEYEVLLKEKVFLMCLQRIQLFGPLMEETQAKIIKLENKLLGRPTDER